MNAQKQTTSVFKSLNLRGKIIVAFLAVSLLSVGLLTYVTTGVVRAELTRNVGANLKSLAASTGQSIGDQLSTQVEAISAVALSKNVLDRVDLANSGYVGTDPAAIQADIDRLDKQWLTADAAQNDNDPLVQSRLNNLLGSQLRGFRDSSPDHVEIFVTDIYGALVAATNRTSDYNQSDEAWWQATYNNGLGAIYIGQPDYDQSSGTTSCIIAIPLYDVNHNVIGVLRTTYRMNTLAKILDSTHLGQTGLNEVLFPNDSWLEPNGEVVILDANVAANFRGAETVEYISLSSEGSDRLVSLAPITTSNPKYTEAISSLGWKVITAQGSAEALQPVSGAVRTSLLTALVILVVSLLLAVFVAQSLSNPIIRLTSIAQQIAGGNLTVQAKVESKDEIGQLASTFNQMTAQLRDSIASLEQRVQERTQALSSVAEVSTAASTILETDELLQQVVDLAKERFNFYHAHIYLLNQNGDTLVLAAGAGEPGRQMVAEKRFIPLNSEQSLVARAARERKGVTVNDVTQTPDFLPNPLLPDTRSELAVPMIAGERVLGVFDVQSEIIGRFTDADIAVQTTLSSQVAIAVQNANQYEETKSALSQSERLFSASDRLARATNLQELTATSVAALNIPVVNRALLAVFTYDANDKMDGMDIIANWWSGVGHEATTVGTHYSSEALRVLSIFTSPTPVFFNDMLNDERIDAPSLEIVKRLKVRAMVGLPLFLGSRHLGSLILQAEEAHNFTQDEIRLFTSLGPQLATILENRRQFERAQEQAKHEAMLNAITQKIQGSTTIEAALQMTARELGRALGQKPTLVTLDQNIDGSNGKKGN